MMPAYVVRQLLLTILMAAAYFAHLPMDAVTAMIAAGLSIWLPMLGQLVLLNRKLKTRDRARPQGVRIQGLDRRRRCRSCWSKASMRC